MNNFQTQFEKNLTTPDLPTEVGEYISDLRKQLDNYQPRMEELQNKGLNNMTNEEIDELTNLNNNAVRILDLIRKSRDEKRIVKRELSEEEKRAEEKAYDEAYEILISKLSPEAKVERYNITIGGKSKEELKQELENRQDIYFGDYAKDLVSKEDFTTSKEIKDLNLVHLTVAEMGFPNGATTDEIYERADELGLDLCPADVGPQLRLQSDTKDYTLIAMKQISDSVGRPSVFLLRSAFEDMSLITDYAKPDKHWDADYRWVFSIRKLESRGE